ncbi:MAG: universal stress protein [Candidatus Lokiarchaeota archaeon]|nr:universal stress protein [Candidatus Lokiarchaeota archaeon]
MMSIKNILIAIDGSEHSEKAINYGIMLAKQNGSKLFGLHVIEEKVLSAYKLMKKNVNELKKELHEKGRYILSNFEKIAISNKIEFQSEIREGLAYQIIIEFAEKNKIDLIIIGHKSDTRPLTSRYIGSTVKSLIEYIICPILIIN